MKNALPFRRSAHFSWLIYSASFLACFPGRGARADWEGKFVTTSEKEKFTGMLFAKGDRYRVDLQEPLEVSLYARSGTKKIEGAVHSFRIRLEATSAKFQDQLPACLAESFAKCVQDLKLKQVGTEKCGGRSCEVFEGKPGLQGIRKLKVWHWAGETQAILARSIVTRESGKLITTVFSDISQKTRPESFFSVPANYKNAGALDRFFGDLQGKSE